MINKIANQLISILSFFKSSTQPVKEKKIEICPDCGNEFVETLHTNFWQAPECEHCYQLEKQKQSGK